MNKFKKIIVNKVGTSVTAYLNNGDHFTIELFDENSVTITCQRGKGLKIIDNIGNGFMVAVNHDKTTNNKRNALIENKHEPKDKN